MNIQNWKKKKINHNFHYEIRNPRTTQEREKIELGNGEETKNDNERAYRFVEVEAWREERNLNKKNKKKNWVFEFVYKFPKKGVYLHFFFFF